MHQPKICVVFILQIVSISCLNILAIFPLVSKSHVKPFEPFLLGLAEKGHNVTVLSYFPTGKKIPNYTDIAMASSDYVEKFLEENLMIELGNEERSWKSSLNSLLILSMLSPLSCRLLFEAEPFKEFVKQNNTFDVVITELFHTECVLPMVKEYNSAIVRVTASTYMPWAHGRYGLPLNPSYMPNIFSFFSDTMTFWERLENTIFTVFSLVFYNHQFLSKENEVVAEYLGERAKTFLEDIYKDSLLLVNRHPSFHFPMPTVPNVIEVGGISVGRNKPLESDLEKWIQEAKDGVIYFSMGSVLKSNSMAEDKKNAFLKAFKRLPQRVIWKWENETMEGKSDKIRIGKWLPQFDILSHPNVKAFIGHGGLGGTFEAIHSGTPMVIMPQFGDQHINAQAMVKAGGGVTLYMSDATEETIYQALKTILEPKFQTQMKEFSERFRDRPMSPVETAIYWVEYVARHKGAHFMKTAAVKMPFYQYYLLDVLSFIISILAIVFFIIYVTVRSVIRKVSGSLTVKPNSKHKKL